METDKDLDLSNSKFQLMKKTPTSAWLEIRLFYVRIAPCVLSSVPDHLTLCHVRREMGVPLEINGVRIQAAESASITLRRDRLNKESSEVTYVSTDSVRVTGGVEFEVLADNEEMVLCGSLERMEGTAGWGNNDSSGGGGGGGGGDYKTGWGMDCFVAAASAKFGVSSSPSVEVYIAGCCGTVPVILTKTIQGSPRRKVSRQTVLDAIPEDEEAWKDHKSGDNNGLVCQKKLQVEKNNVTLHLERTVLVFDLRIIIAYQQLTASGNNMIICFLNTVMIIEGVWGSIRCLITGPELEDYDMDSKIAGRYYSEEAFYGEDGQLSWFNAGVRVGVGIGLGMCVGIGIGERTSSGFFLRGSQEDFFAIPEAENIS
ncbi:hypothetical protein ACFE04_017274 [Oxalis oulophora]